jgi:hypothetical protein
VAGLGRPKWLQARLSSDNPESCSMRLHVCSERAATVMSAVPVAKLDGQPARWTPSFQLSSSAQTRDSPTLEAILRLSVEPLMQTRHSEIRQFHIPPRLQSAFSKLRWTRDENKDGNDNSAQRVGRPKHLSAFRHEFVKPCPHRLQFRAKGCQPKPTVLAPNSFKTKHSNPKRVSTFSDRPFDIIYSCTLRTSLAGLRAF